MGRQEDAKELKAFIRDMKLKLAFYKKHKEKKKPDTLANLRFKVAKRVVDIRLAENEAAEKRQATIERKKRIMEIMAKKQDEDLEGKDLSELQAMLEEM